MNVPLDARFKLFTIASQISVTDATGRVGLYAKQKAFKFKESVTVVADEAPGVHAAAAPEVDAASEKLEFIRFSEDGKGGGTLDTAIATYTNPDGVVVHLVAAVHVGEKAYYTGLAETFDNYDALLYELVKPRDGVVPGAKGPKRPGGAQIRGAAALGGLQSMLKNVLKLDFQLESINYDRPNFVHADLDAETFNELQAQRGESLFG